MTLGVLGVFLVSLLASCGKKDQPFRKVTVSVTGQVFVDGRPPSSPLEIFCVSTGGVDQEHPTASAATTDEQGRFSMSTYVTGDGVPVGEYTLSFSSNSGGEMFVPYAGGGKGKGKSRKQPKKLKKKVVKFQVVEGHPVDLGRIDLTTGDK